jgi:hypothetical protein
VSPSNRRGLECTSIFDRNSFRIRTYEKSYRKSFGIRTYGKTGRGEAGVSSQSATEKRDTVAG